MAAPGPRLEETTECNARRSEGGDRDVRRCGFILDYTRAHGWLREYMVHFRYKWLNYYVRMSKDVVWAHHERSRLDFSRRQRAPWAHWAHSSSSHKVGSLPCSHASPVHAAAHRDTRSRESVTAVHLHCRGAQTLKLTNAYCWYATCVCLCANVHVRVAPRFPVCHGLSSPGDHHALGPALGGVASPPAPG